MKKTLLYILFFITSIVSQAQVTITPSSFNVTDQITITVSTAAQTCNLVGGQEIKFRANDAWGLNYGDNGADASLEEGGSNIAVPSTGDYLVELDLSNPRAYTYTLTPQ